MSIQKDKFIKIFEKRFDTHVKLCYDYKKETKEFFYEAHS